MNKIEEKTAIFYISAFGSIQKNPTISPQDNEFRVIRVNFESRKGIWQYRGVEQFISTKHWRTCRKAFILSPILDDSRKWIPVATGLDLSDPNKIIWWNNSRK